MKDIQDQDIGADEKVWSQAMALITHQYKKLRELERVDQERYKSFLKKRVLQEWRRIRRGMANSDDAWKRMKPFLYSAYREDFEDYSIIKLKWWIAGQKATAQSLHRLEDAQYWGEMEQWLATLCDNN